MINPNMPDHQKLFREMLSHLTLVFDKRNLDKKANRNENGT